MNETIKTQNVGFNSHEIKGSLEKMDAGMKVAVDQLVFYPYFFFEYSLERKSFLHPNGGTVGCTIDALNGAGSLIDMSPVLNEQSVSDDNIIQRKLDSAKAKEIAETFLYDSISYKMKILSMPNLKLSKQEIFFRPYWIVEGVVQSANRFCLTVDSITGKYHPL
ncbi:hypothetical protein [Tuberibacillus sp. Marseille-P3662]|uniref:hypothetical protein n=1 Tax=Tuberibacillus sp. Marseille-P3662 TaxID=1965358 RepID=UPI000A1CA65D|nr:hypothetical protein [Tuberibacillus sp. Marseille-P3662]